MMRAVVLRTLVGCSLLLLAPGCSDDDGGPKNLGEVCGSGSECKSAVCAQGVCQKGDKERDAPCTYDDECRYTCLPSGTCQWEGIPDSGTPLPDVGAPDGMHDTGPDTFGHPG